MIFDSVLDYLAVRLPAASDQILVSVIDKTSTPQIKALLVAYQETSALKAQDLIQFEQVFERAQREAEQLQDSDAVLRVLELLRYDFLCLFPWDIRLYPGNFNDALAKSLVLVEAALQVCEGLQHQGVTAFYLMLQSQILYQQHELEEATRCIDNALNVYRGLCDLQPIYEAQKAVALTHRARILRESEQFRAGRDACQDALDCFEKVLALHASGDCDFGDSKYEVAIYAVRARTWRTLASILFASNRPKRAIQLCSDATKVFFNYQGLNYRRADRVDKLDYIADCAEATVTKAGAYMRMYSTTVRANLAREYLLSALKECQDAQRFFESLKGNREHFYQPSQVLFLSIYGEVIETLVGALSDDEKSGNQILAEALNDDEKKNLNYEFAASLYEKAIEICSQLDTTRINKKKAQLQYRLGLVQWRLGNDNDKAIQTLSTPQQYFQERGMRLDLASLKCDLGQIYEKRRPNPDLRFAFELYKNCVDECRDIVSGEQPDEYHDVFNSKVETAYLRLIHRFVKQQERTDMRMNMAGDDAETLIGYLEDIRYLSTRNAALDAPDGGQTQDADECGTPQQVFGDCWNPQGRLRRLFAEKSCHILWIQHVLNDEFQEEIAFCLYYTDSNSQPQLRCGLARPKFVQHLQQVLTLIDKIFTKAIATEDVAEDNMEDERQLLALGSDLYNELPLSLQDILDTIYERTSRSIERTPSGVLRRPDPTPIVFLSPCSHTVNFPFELLRHPHRLHLKWQCYLGCKILMPRIRSMRELNLINRTPPAPTPIREAMFMVDPQTSPPLRRLHEETVELIENIAEGWRRAGGVLAPDNRVLKDSNATYEALWEALNGKLLALWVYIGHGEAGDFAYENYLSLAKSPSGKGTFTLWDLRALQTPLRGTVVFLGSCVVGSTEPLPGGRWRGFPSMFLQKGASCVFASSFPLFEAQSRQLLQDLSYQISRRAIQTGEAAIKARRKVAKSNPDTPLTWALLTPWGNPWVLVG